MVSPTHQGAARCIPVEAAPQRIIRRYDAAFKQLLAHKPLLAYIMKNTMDEYRDCLLENIVAGIGEEVAIGNQPVDPTRVQAPLSFGLPTEDTSPDEGGVRYDVLFRAQLPNRDEAVGVIVNIEAQTRSNPGYPLLKRAIYYCARLLSAQRSVGDAASDYRELEKVCSIWICIDAPAHEAGGVTEYSFSENHVCGCVAKRDKAIYDLQSVVIVCLPHQGAYNDFIDTMATVFSFETGRTEKLDALKRGLGPSLAREFEGGLDDMGDSPGLYVYECGMEKGAQEATETSLKNIMKNANLDLERAMDLIGLPEEERPLYRKLLAATPQ